MSYAPDDTATLIISRVMRPGREEEYAPWVDRVTSSAMADGGVVATTRLDQAGGIHHLLLYFRDPAALRQWKQGAYASLAKHALTFSVGLDQEQAGASTRFTLPSEAAAKKWKTALVTWLGVVPALLVFSALIGWVAPSLPRPVQQILSSILLTAALTWVILPRVRSWSRFWMLQDSDGTLRRHPD